MANCWVTIRYLLQVVVFRSLWCWNFKWCQVTSHNLIFYASVCLIEDSNGCAPWKLGSNLGFSKISIAASACWWKLMFPMKLTILEVSWSTPFSDKPIYFVVGKPFGSSELSVLLQEYRHRVSPHIVIGITRLPFIDIWGYTAEVISRQV